MDTGVSFSARGARSPAVFVALLGVMAVETVVMHLWLSTHHPVVAWAFSFLSAGTALWFIDDYRALAHAGVRVTAGALELAIGRRVRAEIPRSTIRNVTHATWRDIPDRAEAGYLDVTKPAPPNVLVRCEPAARVRLLGVVTRAVSTIALTVDDAEAFVTLMGTPEA